MHARKTPYGKETGAHQPRFLLRSGMIPWLLVAELLCPEAERFAEIIGGSLAGGVPGVRGDHRKLECGGAIARIRAQYEPAAAHIDLYGRYQY